MVEFFLVHESCEVSDSYAIDMQLMLRLFYRQGRKCEMEGTHRRACKGQFRESSLQCVSFPRAYRDISLQHNCKPLLLEALLLFLFILFSSVSFGLNMCMYMRLDKVKKKTPKKKRNHQTLLSKFSFPHIIDGITVQNSDYKSVSFLYINKGFRHNISISFGPKEEKKKERRGGVLRGGMIIPPNLDLGDYEI